MDVKDAIISRRSVFKFKQDPVPNDIIEQLVERDKHASVSRPIGTESEFYI